MLRLYLCEKTNLLVPSPLSLFIVPHVYRFYSKGARCTHSANVSRLDKNWSGRLVAWTRCPPHWMRHGWRVLVYRPTFLMHTFVNTSTTLCKSSQVVLALMHYLILHNKLNVLEKHYLIPHCAVFHIFAPIFETTN